MAILSLVFEVNPYLFFYLNVELVLLLIINSEKYFLNYFLVFFNSLHLLKLEIYFEQDSLKSFDNLLQLFLIIHASLLFIKVIVQLNSYSFNYKYSVNLFKFQMNLIEIIIVDSYSARFLHHLISQAISKQDYCFKVFENLIQ